MKRSFTFLLIIGLLLAGCKPSTPIAVFPPTRTVAATESVKAAIPEPTSSAQTEKPAPTTKPAEPTRILQPVAIGAFHMTDATNGMAVGGEFGFKDHFLVTSDGGYSWEDRTPAIAGGNAVENPTDLVAGYWGNQDAWVASSFIDLTSPQNAVVYHTGNAGLDFTPSQPLDLQGLSETFYISQITFVNESTGWLLAHVGAGMNHDYIAIFQTVNGGSNWERILDPYTPESVGIHSCAKDQMLFSDEMNGWMTGTCNGVAPGVLLFQTLDGGISWLKVNLPDPTGQPGLFNGQDVVCGSTSPALDSTKSTFSVTVSCKQFSGDNSTQLNYRFSTSDQGQSWKSIAFPGGFWVQLEANQRLAVGEEWQFSSDAGVNWGTAGKAGNPVIQIQVTPEGSIFALTMSETQSEILFSADHGKSWKTVLPGWE